MPFSLHLSRLTLDKGGDRDAAGGAQARTVALGMPPIRTGGPRLPPPSTVGCATTTTPRARGHRSWPRRRGGDDHLGDARYPRRHPRQHEGDERATGGKRGHKIPESRALGRGPRLAVFPGQLGGPLIQAAPLLRRGCRILHSGEPTVKCGIRQDASHTPSQSSRFSPRSHVLTKDASLLPCIGSAAGRGKKMLTSFWVDYHTPFREFTIVLRYAPTCLFDHFSIFTD